MHEFVTALFLAIATAAFWKLCVHDTRRVQKKLVADILSGDVSFFVCGGVVYTQATDVSKHYLMAVPLVNRASKEEASVLLDKTDISRRYHEPPSLCDEGQGL